MNEYPLADEINEVEYERYDDRDYLAWIEAEEDRERSLEAAAEGDDW